MKLKFLTKKLALAIPLTFPVLAISCKNTGNESTNEENEETKLLNEVLNKTTVSVKDQNTKAIVDVENKDIEIKGFDTEKYQIKNLGLIKSASSLTIQFKLAEKKGKKTISNWKKVVVEKMPYYHNYDDQTMLDVANSADINLFFNTFGIGIWETFLRTSLLTNGDVYLGINEADVNGLKQQKLVNKEKWLEFQRKFKLKTSANSQILNLYDSKTQDDYVAIEKWEEIIKANPNKKINVWHRAGVLAEKYFELLTKYENVNLQVVEENPNSYFLFSETSDYKKMFDELPKNPSYNSVSELPNYYEKFFLLSTIKNYGKRCHTWWSIPKAFDFLKSKNIPNHHLMYGATRKYEPKAEKWSVSDALFNSRDIDNNRISVKWWSTISGKDWKKQRDIVEEALSKSKRKSIIFIGEPYNTKQWDLLITAFVKYGDNYEIFFKGHPGHSNNVDVIENKINKAVDYKYIDLIDNKEKTFTMPKDRQIYVLDAQIASEELTTRHVNDEVVNGVTIKGLWFNKWVSATMASNAMLGLNNGKNNYKTDVLLGTSYKGDVVYNIDNPDSMKPFYEWYEKYLNQK